MKLIYRGLSYETTPQKIDMTETSVFVQYRGLTYNIHRPVNLATSPQRTLKYRGISYTTGQIRQPPQPKKATGIDFSETCIKR